MSTVNDPAGFLSPRPMPLTVPVLMRVSPRDRPISPILFLLGAGSCRSALPVSFRSMSGVKRVQRDAGSPVPLPGVSLEHGPRMAHGFGECGP